ncbi:hypothetical protein KKH13_03375 [Patescibacteria group bacterium]|nr:hypothetical protein [Patescibacteria group bacterium]
MMAYLKLLGLILFSSWMIFVKDTRLLILILSLNLLIIYFSRRRTELFSRLRFLAIVVGLIFLLQLITRQPISFVPGLKVGALSLLVLTYTSLSSVKEISQMFSFLGPRNQLLITLTLNLIPLILKEAQNIILVQSSRGRRSFNPFPVIVPLLHRTFQRAQQLTLVLEMKEKS